MKQIAHAQDRIQLPKTQFLDESALFTQVRAKLILALP